ncbi:MAG: Gfo/Idh/MocA family oxidoreductase [Eubacteriales bacterium]
MLKVAMLSKWHVHAGGYANTIKNSGVAEITCVWDDDIARGEAWAKELGCDFVADLDALLARDDVEAVACDTPTTMHHDVLIKAAKAGKHIFTEKALCPTVAECEEVKAAVVASGKTFVISYPMRGTGIVQFAKRMIEAGEFGKISLIRIRNGHNGVSGGWLPEYWFEKKDAAGGAMMDLGCHPMYTLAYLGGKPKRVTGMFNAPFGSKVDENALATVEFENGALGIGETSFITYATKEMIEIYGSDATLLAVGGDVQYISKNSEKYVRGWIHPTLPENHPIPLVQWLHACAEGKPSPEGLGIDDAIALTELLEKSYIADETNKYVL